MEAMDLERVRAYVDGELDAAARARFEHEMAGDAALRAAVERERALRAALADAYGPVLDEPVPASLRALLRPAAPVVDLGAVRAAKAAPAPRRWQWPEWGAMAACLVLGVALGVGGARRAASPGESEVLVARGADGAPVARGALARGLTEALAGDAAPIGGVAVGLTFPARDGSYCRSFVIDGPAASSGLACRREGAWRVQALLPDDTPRAAPGSYRQAATALSPALLEAVERLRDGEVLDAAGERAARDRGWVR